MLVGSEKLFAQITSDTEVQYSTEPREIVPLDDLIHYPEKAKEKGIEGDVIMDTKVLEDGTTSEVEIIKSDNALFNDEAMRVFKSARFEPGTRMGKPRSVWIVKTLHFRFLQKPFIISDTGKALPKSDPDEILYTSQEPEEITPLDSVVHYPEKAREKRLEGKVTLQALIDKDGSVKKVEILKSDDTIFNQEAIRAMKSARFTPANQNGTPLRVWITRTIKFRLKGN